MQLRYLFWDMNASVNMYDTMMSCLSSKLPVPTPNNYRVNDIWFINNIDYLIEYLQPIKCVKFENSVTTQ